MTKAKKTTKRSTKTLRSPERVRALLKKYGSPGFPSINRGLKKHFEEGTCIMCGKKLTPQQRGAFCSRKCSGHYYGGSAGHP